MTGVKAVSGGDLQRAQQAVMPKDDLSPYAGKWVALRDGHVVATDTSGVTLGKHPDVRPGDMLLAVPPREPVLFL
jgi:hypothetical protein